MKKALLFFSCLSIIFSANAQPFRLGLNGGVSYNTTPTRTIDKGSDGTVNYVAEMSFHYNFSDHFQVGASVGMTRWNSRSDVQLIADNGNILGNQRVDFLLAERAFNFGAEFNFVMPVQEAYGDVLLGEFTFGVAAGGIATGADGQNIFDRVNPRTPREYVYRKEFHYESGYGYFVGAQIGYTYFFSNRVGFDLKLAGRWGAVTTIDPRYGGRNERYDLFWFPAMAGLKFRLGSDDRVF